MVDCKDDELGLLDELTDSHKELFLERFEEEDEEALLVDCKEDELGLLDELTDSHEELFLERFEEEDEEAFNFFCVEIVKVHKEMQHDD